MDNITRIDGRGVAVGQDKFDVTVKKGSLKAQLVGEVWTIFFGHAKTVELDSSHVSMLTKPVLAVIRDGAKAVSH